MSLATHLTSTAGFQAASVLSAGVLAAIITSSAADLQSARARHYCAGTLIAIAATAITSWATNFQPAGTCTHAMPPSLHPAAETSTSIIPGYILVFKWCPNCKTSLIDSRDFECYACQDRRYYCSLKYKEE
jgi:hypothetical protein